MFYNLSTLLTCLFSYVLGSYANCIRWLLAGGCGWDVVVLFVEDTIIAFTTVHRETSTTDVGSPIYVLSAAGSPRLLVEQLAAGGERF